jgi:hypothetical protein
MDVHAVPRVHIGPAVGDLDLDLGVCLQEVDQHLGAQCQRAMGAVSSCRENGPLLAVERPYTPGPYREAQPTCRRGGRASIPVRDSLSTGQAMSSRHHQEGCGIGTSTGGSAGP